MRLVDESRPNAAQLEDEGRRIGADVGSLHAIVIVANAPDDAAAVALGIGAVQASQRRVVVADLAGDTTTLSRLVTTDDPHGLSDSFRYGVSLNRVAQPVGDGGNLFVLPGGTEPVVDEEIYRSDRWRRLVAGFREVGALLLLVAPAGAPALEALIGFTDGAVGVGRATVPGLVIDTARVARPTTRVGGPFAVRAAPPAPSHARRNSLLAVAGVLAAAIALTMVFRLRSASPSVAASTDGTAADSVAAAPRRSIDSAAASVAPDTPAIRNLGDSAQATSYSVEIAKFSTPTGALMRVRDELPKTASAATFGVVAIGSDQTLWYRVLAAATGNRTAADSALARLRATKAIDDPAAGAIIRVPFAFRLEQGVAPAAVPKLVANYLTRGVPAYALLAADSTATLYAGAFETADQAALFMTYLRAAGIEPALTYRIGRAF